MSRFFLAAALSAALLSLFACTKTEIQDAYIVSVEVSGKRVLDAGAVADIPADNVEISIEFTSEAVPESADAASGVVFSGGNLVQRQGSNNKVIVLTPESKLAAASKYQVRISSGPAFGLNLLNDYYFTFTTAYDQSYKFPEIPDEDLLTLIQETTSPERKRL